MVIVDAPYVYVCLSLLIFLVLPMPPKFMLKILYCFQYLVTKAINIRRPPLLLKRKLLRRKLLWPSQKGNQAWSWLLAFLAFLRVFTCLYISIRRCFVCRFSFVSCLMVFSFLHLLKNVSAVCISDFETIATGKRLPPINEEAAADKRLPRYRYLKPPTLLTKKLSYAPLYHI
jgi:hypothetical protein